MKKLFLFLITAIVFTAVGVVATNLVASDVEYKNETVESALDSLYTEVDKFKTLTFNFYGQGYTNTSNSNGGIVLSNFNDYYKYFKVTALTKTTGTGTCTLVGWNGSSIELSLNTQYDVSSYSSLYVRAKSSSASEFICKVTIQLYNQD